MSRTGGYDGALKDLFQHDRPMLLERIAGGVAVREFLNVELPKVQDRRADLVVLLEDESILHLEFQSANDARMPYRMAMYHLLLAERYQRQMRHVVLYAGHPELDMAARLDTGAMQFAFQVTDIREIDAAALLKGGTAGDYALAILAGGGGNRIREIAGRIARLSGPARDRAIAQIVVLSGLRAFPLEIIREIEHMSATIDWQKHPILGKLWQEKFHEGMEEGSRALLLDQLKTKFGKLPAHAERSIRKASIAQLSRWARKVVTAETLESVLGPRDRW